MSQERTANQRYPALSLFCGAGIGDLGFRAAGLDLVAACEIAPDRAALAQLNFPQAELFADDVHQVRRQLVSRCRGHGELFLISCTAPCQGMSKNGRGTLLRKIRAGRRPAFDPRNRLILPALDVIADLQPRWVVFENVVEMRHAAIEYDGRSRRILDVIFDRLGRRYQGEAYDVEFADHGIPQRRRRLITVLTRDETALSRFHRGEALIPPASHAGIATPGRKRWVSVLEAIGHFPPLDGKSAATARDPNVPFHHVPVLDPKKYEWIRHTPPGKSAFDNQCIEPACGYQGNRLHGASPTREGINRARRDTPLYCERCGSTLPRPYVENGSGGIRLMSGYTSAYKRMDPDLPAPALTRNLSYPCSDQKLHPHQNRVLSLAEAMRLHTVDRYNARWGPLWITKKKQSKKIAVASDSLIRLVLGESVPPLYFELLGRHLLDLSGRR